jgi:mRNA interferase MazF
MKYQRGDVIEVPFLIPHNNRAEKHPAIIISNQSVYDSEQIYICVMVTHSDISDGFSFPLTTDMFLNPGNAPTGKAKAHLIAYLPESHIIRNTNAKVTMKSVFVDKLVQFITITVFMEE